jgi:hypothetical protein
MVRYQIDGDFIGREEIMGELGGGSGGKIE